MCKAQFLIVCIRLRGLDKISSVRRKHLSYSRQEGVHKGDENGTKVAILVVAESAVALEKRKAQLLQIARPSAENRVEKCSVSVGSVSVVAKKVRHEEFTNTDVVESADYKLHRIWATKSTGVKGSKVIRSAIRRRPPHGLKGDTQHPRCRRVLIIEVVIGPAGPASIKVQDSVNRLENSGPAILVPRPFSRESSESTSSETSQKFETTRRLRRVRPLHRRVTLTLRLRSRRRH
mmetsp:Transcript_29435/g.90054  ORF Transcript_29435/g.90054 Transcript_29435/m.90054 type:complete len:234 (+) Transcript_29435:2242-2943(+)